MTQYEFDALRWCRTMAKAHWQRNEFDISSTFRTVAEEIDNLRARVAKLESVTRMLIGCIEDTKKYPDMHDDFVDELETARRALEEK